MFKTIKYATSGTQTLTRRKGNWLIGETNTGYGPTSSTGLYTAIEQPEGGYTLYLNKATQGPSIYVFNNNQELLDFCNNNLGSNQPNIIALLDWIETQNNYAVDPTYFKFLISTDENGVSDPDQFQLPLVSNGSVDFVVDWGDDNQDTITAYDDVATLHTYDSSGFYTVKIAGKLRGWKFNNGGDYKKLATLYNWGCFNFTDTNTFYGCDMLYDVYCEDSPRISSTSLTTAFRNCYNMSLYSGGTFNNWDVSNVTNFINMFNSANRLHEGDSIPNLQYWDMSSATSLAGMFFSNTYCDYNIQGWDVSNVQNFQNMFIFSSFNEDIGNWDTSSATNMNGMFRGTYLFDQDISNWVISGVTNFGNFLLSNSSFSTENLDKIYNKWSQQNVYPSINISFGNTQYSSAGAAGRQSLIDAGWTITDGGQV